MADDGKALGRGAFYAALDFRGTDTTAPPSAWLGLDTFNGRPLAGIALKRITKLEYYAYVAHIPPMCIWTAVGRMRQIHKAPEQARP